MMVRCELSWYGILPCLLRMVIKLSSIAGSSDFSKLSLLYYAR